jgi:hypothetical protein
METEGRVFFEFCTALHIRECQFLWWCLICRWGKWCNFVINDVARRVNIIKVVIKEALGPVCLGFNLGVN